MASKLFVEMGYLLEDGAPLALECFLLEAEALQLLVGILESGPYARSL